MPRRPLCHSYQAQTELVIAVTTETVRNRGSDETKRLTPDAIKVYTHAKEKGSNRAVSEGLKDEPVVFVNVGMSRPLLQM